MPLITRRTWFVLTFCAALGVLSAGPARAIVTTGSFTNSTAQSLQSADSDPYFSSVGGLGGGSLIYLGNGWALTAQHVTILSSYTANFNTGSYQIANTVGSIGGADLKLVNLTTTPSLPSLTISSSSAPVNARVDMIGDGLNNSGAAEGYFSVSVPSPSSGTWTWTSTSQPQSVNPIPSSTYFAGQNVPAGAYQAAGIPYSGGGLHWGQNLVTGNGQTVNDGHGNTETIWTTFNDPNYAPDQQTVSTWEAQAEQGDSGGGVFYYSTTTSTWELTGMMYAVGNYPNQLLTGSNPPQPSVAANYAVYGNITYIADLSAYRTQILSVTTPLNWTGATSSTWNTSSMNWTTNFNSTTGVLGVYMTSAYSSTTSATFGDTNPMTGAAITNGNITIQSGGVTPASVVFNNSSIAYTLSDATGDTTGIAGTTGLIMNGTARVTLLGANTFSGPVQISAGSLCVQNSAALGSTSGITVASGAALELNGGVTLGAFPLSLAGAGLSATPAGALDSVTGNNSFAGPISLTGAATIGSSSSGAILTLTGGINTTIASSSQSAVVTFAGVGNTAINSVGISGIGSVTMAGTGTLTLGIADSYTGGTVVSGGTLRTTVSGALGSGPLTVNGAVSLGGNETVSSLSGTTPAASLAVAAGDTLTDSQSTGDTTLAGGVALTGATTGAGGALLKAGSNKLELDGPLALGQDSSLTVNGGSLKLDVGSNTASVGTSVTATVSGSATLELAGSSPDLGSTTADLVNVANSSTAAGGLTISGTNQYLGAVTGTGSTTVAANGSVSVASIQQSSLVIGAGGTLTLAPSNSQGKPLADAASVLSTSGSSAGTTMPQGSSTGASLLGSLTSTTNANSPMSAGSTGLLTAGTLLGGDGGSPTYSLGAATLGGGGSTVPEPNTLVLAAFAAGLASAVVLARRRAAA